MSHIRAQKNIHGGVNARYMASNSVLCGLTVSAEQVPDSQHQVMQHADCRDSHKIVLSVPIY